MVKIQASRTWILALIAILILVFAGLWHYRSYFNIPSNRALKLGVSIPENMNLIETLEERFGDRLVQSITAEGNGIKLRVRSITPVDPHTAKELVSSRVQQLTAIYDASIDPYFAVFTRKFECDKKFIPLVEQIETIANEQFGARVFLHATERMGYGVCVNEEAHFLARRSFLYCGNAKRFLDVEYFIPNREGHDWALIPELAQCEK